MGRVLTNNTGLSVAPESSTGTLPGTPLWKKVERNDLTAFGAAVNTVSRTPVSRTRQRRKGTPVSVDSPVELETDLTLDTFDYFIKPFVMANPQNSTVIVRRQGGSDYENLASVAAGPNFTHDALGSAIAENTILYSRAFAGSGNNGRWLVGAAGTTTTTNVTALDSQTMTDETPGNTLGARFDVAGFRFSDLTYDDTGTKGIGSAAVDLTTLGLSAGQFIQVGDSTNGFNSGEAFMGRIVSIATGTIVLDKLFNLGSGTTVGGGDETAAAVDVYFGQFIKNVSTDDANFLEQSHHFELELPNLDNPSGDKYWYSKGQYCNSMAISSPLTDKMGVTLGFIGTDADNPTGTRKTNAANAVEPVGTEAFNTASDYLRIQVEKQDETALTTCVKNYTLTLANAVSPDRCQGTLGATFINFGNFDVGLTMEALFTDSRVVDSIRDNESMSATLIARNSDGGFALDLPSISLGDGTPSFPVNEAVNISLSGESFQDETLSTSIGVSLFPHLPSIS